MNGDAVFSHPGAIEYEMAIRLERLRVREALDARDVAVNRLADACASSRAKMDALDALRKEKERLHKQLEVLACKDRDDTDKENHNEEECRSEVTDSVKAMDDRFALLQVAEVGLGGWTEGVEHGFKTQPAYDPPAAKVSSAPISNVLGDTSSTVVDLPKPPPSPCNIFSPDTPDSPWASLEGSRQVMLPTLNTSEKIEARYSVLASLPLPSGVPDDALTPISIPPPYTLHDYIGTTSGLLRYQLGNYRVFQQSTTTWCPDREEHGYYLAPLFKCGTNPRVNTAHRWSAVDIDARLNTPTECFFNKDGKWYYAGIYKSFRLEDLCTQEWECLSTETSQALIKETLAGRKNTSPQNIYETSQLYSAGALKVACIGLQCIGFNNTLYRGLLEHAALCTHTGKWRAAAGNYNSNASPGPGPGPGLGLASPAGSTGAAWSIPGSPVAPVLSPPQMHAPHVGVGVIGRPPQPPPSTPTYRILQHGPQEFSTNSGERLPGTT